MLGYVLSAVTVLQGIGDDAADGVFGGLGNAPHPGASPELRGADQLRPLNGRDVVELGCQLCALVVALFPKGLEDGVEGGLLSRPVNETGNKLRYQTLTLCLIQADPRAVHDAIVRHRSEQGVPDRGIGLLCATEGGLQAVVLLPEVFHRGKLKTPRLLALRLKELPLGLLEARRLPVCRLDALQLDGVGAVPDLHRAAVIKRLSLVGNLDLLLASGFERWSPLRVLEVGRCRRYLCRVIILVDIDIGELGLVDVSADLAGRHPQLLAGLVLGKQTGVPAVQANGLVELLVSGHDVVEVPHKVITEPRDKLVVDGLLTTPQDGHEDVLGVDELRRFTGGAVTTLRNTHDLPGHPVVLKCSVPQEGTAIHHVHVLHALADLVHRDVAVYSGDAVALKHALEALQPLSPESLSLFVGALWHSDDEVGRGVVEEETLLELRCILVGLDLVGQGLALAQASLEWVVGVKVLHHEHIVHRDLHELPVGEPHRVVREALVRRHLHPMGWNRPKLRRSPELVPLHDEVPFALELEINLQQPPQGRAAHLVKRVRVRPEVKEGVCRDLLLVSVFVHTEQFSFCKGQVRGDALNNREARVGTEGPNPFLGVPLRRVGPSGHHGAAVHIGAGTGADTVPIPKSHSHSPPCSLLALGLGLRPRTCRSVGFPDVKPVFLLYSARASAAVFARMYFIGYPSAEAR